MPEMPAGTVETNARLQAEDGAHSSGILYHRGKERTVVVFNHPRADFSSHYLTPFLVEAGYAVYGGQTRYLGNDVNCEHECLIADLAAQLQRLGRAAGAGVPGHVHVHVLPRWNGDTSQPMPASLIDGCNRNSW